MKNRLILLLAFGVLFIGCQESVYTYRYRAGTMSEYQNLMASWIPSNSTPAPLPPDSDTTAAGWVLESSEGTIIPLTSDDEPLIINKDEYGATNKGVLVSTRIHVVDPYTNQRHYKQAYYLVPPSYYFGGWPYYYGYPSYSYGYGYRYRYGHRYRHWRY
jgi:hypothetical protein